MGQARLRGTKEQRIEQSQTRRAIELEARRQALAEARMKEAERVAALPPEQQEFYRQARRARNTRRTNMLAMTLLGSALGAAATARNK